jgi:hypothetical protein
MVEDGRTAHDSEADRQTVTDRDRDRQTGQTETKPYRQTETDRDRDRFGFMTRHRECGRSFDPAVTDRETAGRKDRRADGQTDRRTDRQTRAVIPADFPGGRLAERDRDGRWGGRVD